MVINDSVISNNVAEAVDSDSYGGGIYGEIVPTEINDSVIADNIAGSPQSHGVGGGIAGPGQFHVNNSSIRGNQAGSGGGTGTGGVTDAAKVKHR